MGINLEKLAKDIRKRYEEYCVEESAAESSLAVLTKWYTEEVLGKMPKKIGEKTLYRILFKQGWNACHNTFSQHLRLDSKEELEHPGDNLAPYTSERIRLKPQPIKVPESFTNEEYNQVKQIFEELASEFHGLANRIKAINKRFDENKAQEKP